MIFTKHNTVSTKKKNVSTASNIVVDTKSFGKYFEISCQGIHSF